MRNKKKYKCVITRNVLSFFILEYFCFVTSLINIEIYLCNILYSPYIMYYSPYLFFISNLEPLECEIYIFLFRVLIITRIL